MFTVASIIATGSGIAFWIASSIASSSRTIVCRVSAVTGGWRCRCGWYRWTPGGYRWTPGCGYRWRWSAVASVKTTPLSVAFGIANSVAGAGWAVIDRSAIKTTLWGLWGIFGVVSVLVIRW